MSWAKTQLRTMSRAYNVSQLRFSTKTLSIEAMCGVDVGNDNDDKLLAKSLRSQPWYESLLMAMLALEDLYTDKELLDIGCRREERRSVIWRELLQSFGSEITAYQRPVSSNSIRRQEENREYRTDKPVASRSQSRSPSPSRSRTRSCSPTSNHRGKETESETESSDYDYSGSESDSYQQSLLYKHGTRHGPYACGIYPDECPILGVICIWPALCDFDRDNNNTSVQQYAPFMSNQSLDPTSMFVMAAVSVFQENNLTHIYQPRQNVFGLIFRETKFPKFCRMEVTSAIVDAVNGITSAETVPPFVIFETDDIQDPLTSQTGMISFMHHLAVWKQALLSWS